MLANRTALLLVAFSTQGFLWLSSFVVVSAFVVVLETKRGCGGRREREGIYLFLFFFRPR